jgi:5-methylcytosine-specific restriction enzyme subunit McrC
MVEKQQVSEERLIGRIPVRNLWILMLYASDLLRIRGNSHALLERDIDELPELIARLLTNEVELRMRRNLTRGYIRQERVLKRVRGRIDMLATESSSLLSRGEVFCRFEELDIDTPRNRLVRSALELMARLVKSQDLRQRCRALALGLGRAGVSSGGYYRSELSSDQMGRNDSAERFMVTLARLAFNLALPTEETGRTTFAAPDREEVWVRRLFEKAVLGFAKLELEPLGWTVRGGSHLEWSVSASSAGLDDILPRMETDIILEQPKGGRRLIIDTKFTSILAKGQHGTSRLKSGYLYQMYAYVRSQEGRDPRWDDACGMFLHPAIDGEFREHVVIQNHAISFVTVDLSASSRAIREELREILLGTTSERAFGLADLMTK